MAARTDWLLTQTYPNAVLLTVKLPMFHDPEVVTKPLQTAISTSHCYESRTLRLRRQRHCHRLQRDQSQSTAMQYGS
ncbi:unnamed protein product, partial [Brenthis ino]